MRGQYQVPKHMKKGDNSEAEVNFQPGSGIQGDVHLRHHSLKNHLKRLRMVEKIRVSTKKKIII